MFWFISINIYNGFNSGAICLRRDLKYYYRRLTTMSTNVYTKNIISLFAYFSRSFIFWLLDLTTSIKFFTIKKGSIYSTSPMASILSVKRRFIEGRVILLFPIALTIFYPSWGRPFRKVSHLPFYSSKRR